MLPCLNLSRACGVMKITRLLKGVGYIRLKKECPQREPWEQASTVNIEIIRIIRMNYLFVIHSNNIFLIFIQQAKLRGGQKSRNVPNHVDQYDNIRLCIWVIAKKHSANRAPSNIIYFAFLAAFRSCVVRVPCSLELFSIDLFECQPFYSVYSRIIPITALLTRYSFEYKLWLFTVGLRGKQ